MKLNEILNRKVDYEVTSKTDVLFRAKAEIGNREIIFEAKYDKQGKFWDIGFKERNDDGITYDTSGSGNEFEVFAMVKDCITEMIAHYKPDTLIFSADMGGDYDTRADVYERLMKKFKVPGYTVTRKDKSLGKVHKVQFAEFSITKDKQ